MLEKNVPRDASGASVQLVPSTTALATTYDETISSSTEVTLNAATSIIEVSALSSGIFMKWGGTASNTSFDEFIGDGMTRQYEVPVNPSTGDRYTTAQFIEKASSATLVLIEK